jgi:hypothetical protein
LDKLFEKPVKSPGFLLNLRKLFQKLKFWNSLGSLGYKQAEDEFGCRGGFLRLVKEAMKIKPDR